MKSVKFYPTAKFGDSFVVCNHLFSYMSTYVRFTIRLYRKDIYQRKLICDFYALSFFLSTLELEKYSDVVVFGHTDVELFESEILFAIYYDFCVGKRCIKFYL